MTLNKKICRKPCKEHLLWCLEFNTESRWGFQDSTQSLLCFSEANPRLNNIYRSLKYTYKSERCWELANMLDSSVYTTR